MDNLGKLEDIVTEVLQEHPMTRGSDSLLYAVVCEFINPTACKLAFTTVMMRRSELGLPKFDSVSRVRRKIQEKDDSLRPPEDITDGRFQNWKKVRRYVRHE